MDIYINAIEHDNHTSAESYYQTELTKRLSKYQFIHSVELWVRKTEDHQYKVSIKALPKGGRMFAEEIDHNEEMAFTKAIKKLRAQLSKFKTSRFRSQSGGE